MTPARSLLKKTGITIRPEDLLDRPPIQLNVEPGTCRVRDRIVLVTGAAGSIGSELVRQLVVCRPAVLILLDQAESALFELVLEIKLQLIPSGTDLQAQVGNITDEVRMRHIFNRYRPELVFHAAAYKHVPLMEDHPDEAVRVNLIGTQVMADLAIEFGVNKFMLISTDKAVNPISIMGVTKRLAEQYLRSLSVRKGCQPKFIVVRFGNVLGSNGSVMRIFERQIQQGGPVTVTHPDATRYFITIFEACQLVLEAAAVGKNGEILTLDMGKPVRIADLAQKMIRLAGYTVGEDIPLIYSGLRPGEKLHEEVWDRGTLFLPTHHPKIKIMNEHCRPYDIMRRFIRSMRYLLQKGDIIQLANELKKAYD